MRAIIVSGVFAGCLLIGLDARADGIDMSPGAGLVYRSIQVPSNANVCVPLGRYCPTVGSIASDSTHVEGVGGLFGANFLKEGPLRVGTEFSIGGTTSGIDGTYGTDPVRVSSFLFVSAGFGVGLATSFDRFHFRVDGLAGIYYVKAGTSLRTVDGLPLDVMATTGYVEGRATVAYFVSPHVAIAALGGAGVNMLWHTGMTLTFYFDPNDKNR
jgi:hypothetical protein